MMRARLSRAVPLALSLLLQSCAPVLSGLPSSEEVEASPPEEAEAPSPVAPTMEGPTPVGAGPPTVTVGDYLYRGQQEPADLGAYGYVVLTERPIGAADTARLVGLCNAFKAGLIPRRDVPPGTLPVEIAVTYWPTDTLPPAGGAEEHDCVTLVRRYDYGVANRLAVRVGRSAARGPILVALPVRQGRSLPPGADVLVVDASDVSDRFRRLFAVWRDHITDDPSRWRIDPVGFRAATAIVAFLEEFGPQVLSLIRLP